VVFGDHRQSHAEFAASVDRVAKGLMGIGVQSGDRVAVWMTNRPAWLHLMYAVPKVGACLVPLNTRYRSDDMAFTVVNSQSSVLITIDRSGPIDFVDLLGQALPTIEAAGHLRTIVTFERASEGEGPAFDADSTTAGNEPPGGAKTTELGWPELLAAGAQISDEALAARSDAVDGDQLMMLAYTSGTTGDPKGVMHSHRPVRNIRERAMLLGHQQTDVHLNYLPLFHIYSLTEVAAMAALTGGSQVLFETFDADAALDAVEVHGATVLHGFDSHWGDLLAAQERRPRDVSSLRIGSLPAGMESTIPIARRANQVFCTTISGFGMSECGAFICCSHPSHSLEQRTEASGYPMDGVEVEIRNPETGAVEPPGVAGRLYIRNFTVTAGYWANPDATAAAIEHGWLDTGDMALVRPDGHVVFIGRYKDMLKVGGENMSPAEVEGYLLDMPGVAEAAVVAYPDQRLSEVPVAYVVRSKDADDEPPSEQELIDSLRGRIAGYKIPRAVIFVDEMPMTPSGKIRKVELRDRALADLGQPE
jgi:fatty-acyl-CoA synthase